MFDSMQYKVSIITPVWNGAKFIEQTIASVQAQTYENWEMIIVDDCSTDRTFEIVESLQSKDKRIRLFRQKQNMGAPQARNFALSKADGRFVAYLDADDCWKPRKLEKQVAFMLEKQCSFSCVSYDVIDNEGRPLNKTVHMLPDFTYKKYLANNLIQTVGVMIDLDKVDRNLLVMPNKRVGEDAATWFKVLKAGHVCLGMQESLAEYRRTKGSLSSNKIKSALDTWHLYRHVERLPLPYSLYCFARYAIFAVWKRIYSH